MGTLIQNGYVQLTKRNLKNTAAFFKEIEREEQ
jgi:hypothetical protein